MSHAMIVGIVGATGVVGQTALEILETDREYLHVKEIKLFASKASAGKIYSFRNKKVAVEELNLESMASCDVLFFAAGGAVSKEYIPPLIEKGVLCIDKSAEYRLNDNVPLVVPEVNAHALQTELLQKSPLIANPNCCTVPLVIALKALDEAFGVERVVISTYQSVSGAGKPAMDILTEESKQFFLQSDLSCKSSDIFPKSIAFNVIPFVEALLENGDTEEESKIIAETRKILSKPQLPVAATSVRVPTFVGHAEAVALELSKPFQIEQVKKVLKSFPGIQVITETDAPCDDLPTRFVTPREAQGQDEVFVSRLRKNEAFSNGLSFWVVSDNLRKGAALNAIQIVDLCIKKGFLARSQKS